MEKISGVNKEFDKRTIRRMRNLTSGNQKARTIDGTGYKKKIEERKEGDIWEENSRKWTIKDGIKQNITKLDSAKQAFNMPLFCPSCRKKTSYIDKPYWVTKRMCLDCTINFEADLKKKGLYDNYLKSSKNNNIDSVITDFKDWYEAMLVDTDDSFITEAGDIEKWSSTLDKKRITNSLKETIDYLESLKEQ